MGRRRAVFSLKHRDKIQYIDEKTMNTTFEQQWQQARSLRDQGRLLQAVDAYESLIQEAPQTLPLHLELGNLYLGQECPRQAEVCFRAALVLAPHHFEAHLQLANALLQKGAPQKALPHYTQAMDLEPERVEAHFGKISVLKTLGKWDDILSHIQQIEPHFGPRLELSLARASVHENLRQFDEGYVLLRPLMETHPLCPPLVEIFSRICIGLGQADQALPYLEATLQGPPLPPRLKRPLLFILGQIYHQKGQADQAFGFYHQGNQLKPHSFDPQRHRKRLQTIETLFHREQLSHMRQAPPESPTPVFIVGMPRSGTSLTEQILASHPLVTPLGEQPYLSSTVLELFHHQRPEDMPGFLRQLTSADWLAQAHKYRQQVPEVSTPFFTDKMPANFELIGMMFSLFPNAKVIHTQRHPLDTALSCYMQNFHYVEYSNDLEHLGHYYASYWHMMRHWKSIYGAQILDFPYEDLLRDQEAESRKLLAFCGLNWDPACLSFYKNRQETNTASSAQVKKPLYASARGRYQRYLKHLGPFIAILKQHQIPIPPEESSL